MPKASERFKVSSGIFDERTLMNVYSLLNKGVIDSVESVVKEGKEACVLAGIKNGKWVAIKVYRTLACDYKRMWKYLVSDPRFDRVKKDRFAIVFTWAKREYKNLKKAFEKGVSCPRPFFVYENILGMEFIGKDGIPAPQLKDVEEADFEKLYEKTIEYIIKLYRHDMIHADLSEYNILVYDDEPVFIDFGQAVNTRHPNAFEFLMRDIRNVNRFFGAIGIEIYDENDIFEKCTGEKYPLL